jgi:hypothetical protein
MAKKKKKTGTTTRQASDQCKTSVRGCYSVKYFRRKNDLCYPLSSAWFVRYEENVWGSRGGA